ncbi:hypothetical protein FJV41_18425 [Myxococcus llanfairpwllgwyngyllgogerychwyrndrobwllllantysiliogogogochensis]|uniref:Peptidase S1 domain-containing protein n=1 Tax=Myxococcus llanfairpwllgwyngyllgogerychwyrndrobwllllantysiliogogogochensis TaxID=2590453 RepID=A0A540WZS5_9BACT|nr:hypothetical protein [Myxococcus llanfairpwllgwyngyllgogerychwyrndrobwllllantysiliogogogochensis]TQF14492.1 hypothetical protein FJV41_18425 [Myxococcus llanfairpwllgwyngyllgogerychwyrndrobwllllantysiliogogogochensis]
MKTSLRAAFVGTSIHLVILGAVLAACDGPGESPPQEPRTMAPQAVQRAYQDYYSVALAPGGPTGSSQLSRGTVFVPILQPVTHAPLLGLDGTPLRYTCGVTFISPRRAITAAHCLDDVSVWDPANQALEVRMYDPMIDAEVNWEATAESLSGTFPGFQRTPLGGGYSTSSYSCRVIARCGDSFGNYQCPASFPRADTALLDCGAESPGCRYDYLDVAESEGLGVPVSMAWAHEVYSIPEDRSTELWQRYTRYIDYEPAQNYHYYGVNQLLPLLSRPWSNPSRPRVSLGLSGFGTDARLTELHGCHGSSGSGITQLNEHLGTQELLGPVAVWAHWVFPAHDYDFLCEDPARTARLPGDAGLGYARLAFTRKLVESRSPDDVCDTLVPGLFPNPLLWLTHDVWLLRRGALGTQPFPKPWPCTASSCSAWERLRFPNEPLVPLARGESLTLPSAEVIAGMTYRVSVRIRALEGTPATVTLSLGTQSLLSNASPVALPGEAAGLIATTFVPLSGAAQPLRLAPGENSGAFAVTEVVVVADPLANGFEYHSRRVGMGILEPGARTPVPATWTRLPPSRFAALLRGGQRFVVTRQAFVSGRAWTVEFDTSRDTVGVSCGFITADGRELRTRCNAVRGRVRTHFQLGAAQPVAFFVDLPAGQPDLILDNLRLVTR